MKKIYFMIVLSLLGTHIAYGQSKADLKRSIEELRVIAIQNQTKIEFLLKDVENLKSQAIVNDYKIQSQEKEILNLNQRLNGNTNIPANVSNVQNIPVERNSPVNSKPSVAPVRSQCGGITKAGNRCKRSGGSRGYCYQHGG